MKSTTVTVMIVLASIFATMAIIGFAASASIMGWVGVVCSGISLLTGMTLYFDNNERADRGLPAL